jgi:protocatechuate 3,4-dioxygenase beta subunit
MRRGWLLYGAIILVAVLLEIWSQTRDVAKVETTRAIANAPATRHAAHGRRVAPELPTYADIMALPPVRGVTVRGRIEPPTHAALWVRPGAGNDDISAHRIRPGFDTDDHGDFTLTDIPPGKFVIEARCVEGTGALAITVADKPLGGLIVRLDPGTTLRGQVVDSYGQPAPGAHVGLLSAFGEVDIHADADGKFEFRGVQPIRHWLIASRRARPFGAVTPYIYVPPDSTGDVTLKLPKDDGVIRGVVVGADGKPAAGARVSLQQFYGVAPSLTGPDGTFTFEHLLSGSYDIAVESATGDARAAQRASPGDTPTMQLALLQDVVFRVSASGRPVTRFKLSCSGRSPSYTWFTKEATDKGGVVRVEHVTSAAYRCLVDAAEGVAEPAFTVGSTTTEVDVALDAWASLTATVLAPDSDEPVANTRIFAMTRNSASESVTDERGHVTFERVTPHAGEIGLSTRTDDGLWEAQRVYTVSPGQTADLGMIELEQR